MKTWHVLAILVLGFAAFWYFGQVQPVRLEQQAVPTTKSVVCADCGGFGFVDSAPQKCAKCRGTGQGEWQMKGKSSRKMSNARPACVACSGRGTVSTRTTCPHCNGTGKTSEASSRTIRTARAGISPWEKFLGWFGFEPEANPAPQMDRNGEYPLVAIYLEAWVHDQTYRVVDWGTFEDANGSWQATLFLESTLDDGSLKKWKVAVRVRDRAVVGCKTVS